MKKLTWLAIAVAMAFGWASQAPAESLDLEEMAAALIGPYLSERWASIYPGTN